MKGIDAPNAGRRIDITILSDMTSIPSVAKRIVVDALEKLPASCYFSAPFCVSVGLLSSEGLRSGRALCISTLVRPARRDALEYRPAILSV